MSNIYYLFRHGETYFSKNALMYGDAIETAEILPEATSSIVEIGQFLATQGIDQFFCSPLLRCKQTAEIVSKEIGIKFVVDQRLTEYPESGDFEQFVDRMGEFLKFTEKEFEGKKIAVCTHGGCVAALKNLIVGGEFMESQLAGYEPCGVVTIVEDGKLREADFR